MAPWEYRVFKHKDGSFGLYESDPTGRCESPVQDTVFESLGCLKADVAAMLAAFDKPVLED